MGKKECGNYGYINGNLTSKTFKLNSHPYYLST